VKFEERGAPLLIKALNVNGCTLGAVFFVLFLCTIIRLYKQKNIRYLVGIVISILGLIFFYPPMIFALCFSLLALGILWLLSIKKSSGFNLYLFGVACIILFSFFLMIPYLKLIASNTNTSHVLSFYAVPLKCLTYFIYSLPFLLLCYFNPEMIRNKFDKTTLWMLGVTIAATGFSYLFIHLSLFNEYKALLLSILILGIISGGIFDNSSNRKNKWIYLVLTVALTMPIIRITNYYSKFQNKTPVIYTEKSRALQILDSETQEFYEWIKKNTNQKSIFFDTTITLPVFAARSLYIAPDQWETIGFNCSILDQVCQYDSSLLERRKKITQALYAGDTEVASLINSEFPLRDIYIIIRTSEYPNINNIKGFQNIFESSMHNLLLFQFKK